MINPKKLIFALNDLVGDPQDMGSEFVRSKFKKFEPLNLKPNE